MHSPELSSAIASFGDTRGYLAAASIGLPPRQSVEALQADLAAWYAADRDPQGYDPIIERTRASYARLVGVPESTVAIGSQTSVMTSLVAAAVPAGAEVLAIDGDFSSILLPFAARGDIRLRLVSLGDLASAITDDTWLVVFSLVQSSTGEVADSAAIVAAAAAHGAYTFCDTTQATGVHPVDASRYDVSVCHAYKWLCSPRGVAFMTLSTRFNALMTPLQAGWYAGEDVWRSCYGAAVDFAAGARRFDVSPAWQAWVGAEHAIALFAGLEIAEVWEHSAGLGALLTEGLGLPRVQQAIVAWPDPDGSDLRTLIDAGIRVSGRAGRCRASFHLWNTVDDVEWALSALGR